jgi:hypothetical protein
MFETFNINSITKGSSVNVAVVKDKLDSVITEISKYDDFKCEITLDDGVLFDNEGNEMKNIAVLKITRE